MENTFNENQSRDFESDEREAAACLLQLSGKAPDAPLDQEASPKALVVAAAAPKKRGRKPKVKKITPQLMKQTQKSFKNLRSCFASDKVKLHQGKQEVPQEVEGEEQRSSSPELQIDLDRECGSDNNDYKSSSCQSQQSDVVANTKIHKIKLVKDVDGANWCSKILKTPVADMGCEKPPEVCEQPPESDIQKEEPEAVVSVQKRFVSSMDTLPANWLPFKKRKFNLSFENTEVEVEQVAKPAEEVEWQPPSPASLTDPPDIIVPQEVEVPRKISILEQACVAAGIKKSLESLNTQDDLQVIFEKPKSEKPVSPKLPKVLKVKLPKRVTDKLHEAVAAQENPYQTAATSALLSTVTSSKEANSSRVPLAAVVHPVMHPSMTYIRHIPPLREVPPEPLLLSNGLPFCSGTAVHSAGNTSSYQSTPAGISPPTCFPQLTSQVFFRILCDSWPMQPKFSVYEVQPFKYKGHTPQGLVSTFVLFHKQRSETKSLHYLNKFPSLGEVHFEYLPKLHQHPRTFQPVETQLLPNNVTIQQIAEDQFIYREDYAMLLKQFPHCSFFSVQENQVLIVNKVGVIEIGEETGWVLIKVYAFSTALLKICPQTVSEKSFDSWFAKVAGTLEVYRLCIPAWVFFSREVIRLQSV